MRTNNSQIEDFYTDINDKPETLWVFTH